MSLETTEAECAAGAVAPRVSLADIEGAIAETHYGDGEMFGPSMYATHLLTICLVVMTNGFMVLGKSAPAAAANFKRDLGRKLAYEDAIRQIWSLMGFALRDRLACEGMQANGGTHVDEERRLTEAQAVLDRDA